MRYFKKSGLKLLILFMVLAFSTQAHAIAITPSTGTYGDTMWYGLEYEEGNPDISSITGSATELYKAEVNTPVIEEGILSGSYETVFSNTDTDPADATIIYQGGNIVGPVSYLFVKDGRNEPYWYLFNLTTLFSWNGIDPLSLEGFWPNSGAISHVSLFGTAQPIPEPATMLLLGVGLAGIAGMRKKFAKK